jgi:putative NIF3 family GTP cyclohydrolase 1 type 2
MENAITRRGFGQWVGGVLAAGSGLAGAAAQAQGTITARQVADRIKAKLAGEGLAWRASTYFDGFKMGDPDVTLTGIATCFQPTFSVLRRAAAAKRNLVISHECVFWDGFDPIEVVKDDPVAKAKIRFVEQNKMAVWRIHDHWHARKPDPIFRAMARKLGWESYYTDVRPRHYTIPEMSLEEVARHIQNRIETKNVVVVGDPKMRVKTVGDQTHILSAVLPGLRNFDVVMAGETPQYDTFEYVRDAVALGQQKAVLMISHEGLEEWGMEAFVDWFKPSVPEVPIEWISTGDPFNVPPVKT